MTPNTETAGKLAVTIDPNGAWNDERFAFCNALETALDEAVAPQIRAAAWDELERLGVAAVAGTPIIDGPFAGTTAKSNTLHWVAECPLVPGSPLQYAHYQLGAIGYRLEAISHSPTAIKAEQGEQTP